MTKLTQQQKDLLRLIERSPAKPDGWKSVSKLLWPSVKDVLPGDLAEQCAAAEDDEKNGGFIRLTANGEIVLRYL